MRRAVVLWTLFALLGLPACRPGSSGTDIELGTPFSLSVGETRSISSQRLKVQLSRVVADSRCPEGVTCVRAGEAILSFRLTLAGKSQPEVLLGLPPDSVPDQQTVEGFTLKIEALEPHPKVGAPPVPGDYRATLRITKGGA